MDYLLDAMGCKLLGADPGRIDSVLDCILSKICPVADVEFLCVSGSPDAQEAVQGYCWYSEKKCQRPPEMKTLRVEDLPSFRDRLVRLEAVHIPHVSEMTEEARSERDLFESIQAASIVLIPFGNHNTLGGIVVLGSGQSGKVWDSEQLRLFKRVGLIISEFLAKRSTSNDINDIEARMQAMLDASIDVVLCFNKQGTLVTANNVACELFGYTARELAGQNVRMLLPEDSTINEWAENTIISDSWIRNVKKGVYRTTGKHRDGSTIPLVISMSEVHEKEKQMVVAILREAPLRSLALHDHLTGMSNRPYFLECLRRSFQRAQKNENYSFAILLIDIDRFKLINDGLGHTAGDKLLELVGQRLMELGRPGDNISRLGGDEFAFILHHIKEAKDAVAVADRVLNDLESPFTLKQQEVFISASIGIALSMAGYNHYQDLLRDADNAMFSAKNKGRARHETFHSHMHVQALDTLKMEAAMHNALKDNSYNVYYQPIVSLASGGVIGFEALIRWQHPELGWISPNDFIPLSEETSLITSIGEWVLRIACKQLKQWKDSGMNERFISVNCSTKQIIQPGFLTLIKELVKQNEIDPKLLELEITESIAMKKHAIDLLKTLRDIGIRISIDDFGTGYSSLSELNDYPLDTLKIDKSFVDNISKDSSSIEIILAIMSIAWKLNLRIIAEGVETAEQLEFFRSLKCDAVQGFIFAKPMPAEEIDSFINTYDFPRTIRPLHESPRNYNGGLGLSM